MQTKQTHIVVVGGGYAGLMATIRLAAKTRRSETTITLVNGTEHFIERLRLHQMAANQQIPQHSITKTLRGTGVDFVQGWVTEIRPDEHRVDLQTDNGARQIGYDYLVYALGSTIERDSVSGVRHHAYTLTPSGEMSIEGLREVLPALNAISGRLLIVGGGATGIEAAAEFAESFPNVKVQLVTRGEFGGFITKGIADYMGKSLRELGVSLQDHTTISELREREAITSSGVLIPFDVCLWTGGFSVPKLARETGLKVNERGQILTDMFLRSISHPDIFACGDT
ncbi:MAG: FAD-dependent oxidoreductase, partial [Burkholderiales bacterium]|nr:FAD-dependent oxidoreductase [Anaerolineae bacterium]